MKSTTISHLKSSLSEFLSKVKAGEELIITERGRTIAKIIPVKRDRHNIPSSLYALERAGLARIGTHVIPRNFWSLTRPTCKKNAALKALLKDREEGR